MLSMGMSEGIIVNHASQELFDQNPGATLRVNGGRLEHPATALKERTRTTALRWITRPALRAPLTFFLNRSGSES